MRRKSRTNKADESEDEDPMKKGKKSADSTETFGLLQLRSRQSRGIPSTSVRTGPAGEVGRQPLAVFILSSGAVLHLKTW